MLLYAQDEIGYLSDAVIAEVAERIGITELDVRNVATYYSMLRFKPAGKYNVQVCTNISCMLRGGYEIYERFQEELGIGHKGVTAGRVFRSKRSSASGPVVGRRHSGELRLSRRADARSRCRHSGRLSRQAKTEGKDPCLDWSPIPMR